MYSDLLIRITFDILVLLIWVVCDDLSYHLAQVYIDPLLSLL